MSRPRKPCDRCGGEKKPGPGQKFCAPCDTLRFRCDTCGMPKPRPERKLCDSCNYEHMKRFVAAKRTPVADSEPPGKRWCKRCEQYLPLRSFTESKGKRGGLATYCKTCNSLYHWARRITKVYGITPEQYFELLAAQGGRCAICELKPRTMRLAVDHNHKTGAVRGLLCTSCNHKVLGGAKESVQVLRRAANYLENPPAFAVLGAMMEPEEEATDALTE